MDERELDARIGARLHARFDGAQAPVGLRATLQDVPSSGVKGLPRPMSLAWFVAAVVTVAIVAGVGLRWLGPGSSDPSTNPTASPVANRTWTVRPSGETRPAKEQTELAAEIFALRIRALGIGNFTSAAGDAITFELPGDADASAIQAVLAANGELSFVPLPPEDYGEGGFTAVIGEPLPKAEPELFGADDIASAGVATEGGVPARVHFSLKPAAAAALDTYTSSSIGQTFAVLLDDNVVLLPTIVGSISDGRLEITAGSIDLESFKVVAAIVTSGTLPQSWRNPIVE